MSVVEPGSAHSGLVDRVKAILLKPKDTWNVIDGEAATIGGLYRSYVVPLAAIPAVCGLIGSLVFGYGAFGITYRPPVIGAVAGAAVGYALNLAGVYVLALIIEALAPNFDGTKDRIQAFKVAAYAGTASWVVGAFQIFPPLSILGLLGLYSLYLLFTGIPRLMKSPEEKAMPYTVVVIIVAVVLSLIAGAVVGPITRMAGGPGPLAAAGSGGKLSGALALPGGSSVDVGKLEAASKRMEAAAQQMQAGADGKGGVQPTNPDLLKAYLPEGVDGFARSAISTGSGGVAGVSGSSAEATYAKGDANFRLTVTDMGAAGAFAAMAGAFNVQSSSETEGKYEKVGKVDGRMTQESYDRTSKHGEYSVMVGDRFIVAAEGDNVAMDDLKSAVGAIDPEKLESLAKSAG